MDKILQCPCKLLGLLLTFAQLSGGLSPHGPLPFAPGFASNGLTQNSGTAHSSSPDRGQQVSPMRDNTLRAAASRWWHRSIAWWKVLPNESKIGILGILAVGITALVGYLLMYVIPRAQEKRQAREKFLALGFPVSGKRLVPTSRKRDRR